MTTLSSPISDFGRTIRDEPLWYVFTHRIWLADEVADPEEVRAWLHARYMREKGNRYRVTYYKHKDGQVYVDSIYLENPTNHDLTFVKVKWGWEETRVQRGNRVPTKKLSPEGRKKLEEYRLQLLQEGYAT